MTYADKVRLQLLKVDQTIVVDGAGPRVLCAERLFMNFKLAGQSTWYDGIFDSGAMLSVLPYRMWSHSEVEWIHPLSGQAFPDWAARVSGITGGGIECQLGIVTIQFCDLDRRSLRPVKAVVKCLPKGFPLPRPLIGLGGSLLEERRVTINYSAGDHSAWLSEKWAIS